MSLHRVREGLKEECTACINQIRGLLSEFGLVFGKSPKVLRAVLAETIEDAANELSTTARRVLDRAFTHWRELDAHMHWCNQQIGQLVKASPAAQRAAKIIGIGELGASALTACVHCTWGQVLHLTCSRPINRPTCETDSPVCRASTVIVMPPSRYAVSSAASRLPKALAK
jgi:hypothetical protein